MSARARPLASAAAAGLLAAACVTVYEDAPLVEPGELERPEYAVAQAIPLGRADAPNDAALLQLYGGVLQRLQEAADDRDVPALFALLDAYEKPGLPDWLGDRLRGYRALGHGLRFLAHAAASSRLDVVAADADAPPAPDAEPVAPPPVGAPIHLLFSLPAPPAPVLLGGQASGDPVGFLLGVTYEDDLVNGDRMTRTWSKASWLGASFELGGDAVLRLPLSLDLAGSGVVRRRLHVRIDLIGGYVKDGEFRAPVARRALCATTLTQWPAGYEPIAARPLVALREAIRLGDEKHYAHVFLGAWFTTGPDREAAIGLLVDQVRFGSPPQAVVAMAALRAITGVDVQVGDREGWLAWYDMRQ